MAFRSWALEAAFSTCWSSTRGTFSESNEHAETSPEAADLVVTPLSCSLVGQEHRVVLLPGSRAADLYGSEEAVDYYCNYGLNPDYRPRIEESGSA